MLSDITQKNMKPNRLFLLFFILFFVSQLSAQEDLLNQLDTIKPKEKQIEMAAFKGLQVCSMQSTKLPIKGEWYFLVSHRFGDLKEGINNFFGLEGFPPRSSYQ